jgi:hypothetical protein
MVDNGLKSEVYRIHASVSMDTTIYGEQTELTDWVFGREQHILFAFQRAAWRGERACVEDGVCVCWDTTLGRLKWIYCALLFLFRGMAVSLPEMEKKFFRKNKIVEE